MIDVVTGGEGQPIMDVEFEMVAWRGNKPQLAGNQAVRSEPLLHRFQA